MSKNHFGDPCIHCGVPHDEVPPGPCSGRAPQSKTPLEYGAPAYTIRVTRLDCAGRIKDFEFDGYGVLRELLDDVEAEAEKRGWFGDTNSP
jgi:hypothetical protein